MKSAWTRDATLPGGDLPGRRPQRVARGAERPLSAVCRPTLLRALAQRHGTRALAVLGDAKTPADLGETSARSLTAREVDYLRRATNGRATADDVLWRRTKCGLPMTRRRARARGRVHGAAARRVLCMPAPLDDDAGRGCGAASAAC